MRRMDTIMPFFSLSFSVSHASGRCSPPRTVNFSKVRKPHLSPEAQIAHTSRAESYGNGQTFRTKGEAHLPNYTFAFPGLDKSFSFSCKVVCLFARLSCALAYLKPIRRKHTAGSTDTASSQCFQNPVLPHQPRHSDVLWLVPTLQYVL